MGSRRLSFFVYPGGPEAVSLLAQKAGTLVNTPEKADVALAPLLTRRLSRAELNTPKEGVLVFHPSLLPRHRGPDAIRWAYEKQEAFTGVTWFWANERMDEGDICEQEVVPLVTGLKPGDFYRFVVIPAMLRTLRFALREMQEGVFRRRPQNQEAATYESWVRSRSG